MSFLEKIPTASTSSSFNVQKWRTHCYAAMNDDFNTPVLISHLFEAVKAINLLKEQKASITVQDLGTLKETLNNFVFDILGLTNEVLQSNSGKINGVVELLFN